MTPAELRTEIETGSLAAALADFVPGGNKHTSGEGGLSWAACIAARLNAATQRGPVPIEELAAYCCKAGVTGGVLAMIEIPIGSNIVDGVPMTLPIKGLLHTVLTLIRDDYRLTTADVDDTDFVTACDGLVSLGIMTGQQKTEVIALGDNRLGRVPGVTESDVTMAFSES